MQNRIEVPEVPREPPLLIVLSGPSGAGKDSVRDKVLDWVPRMHRVSTATTREVRPGEQSGRDYHFVSEPEFRKILETGGFVEHAVVYGQHYGVPRIEIEDPLNLGRDAIARVDIQGAATLKRLFPDALLIFIAPPSVEETVHRLQTRGGGTAEDQARRSEVARQEMEHRDEFDAVVVNETDQLEETALAVIKLIVEEKKRRSQNGAEEK